MTAPQIALDAVRFSYGETAMAFDGIVPAGSFTAVMGPSGAGKTTLLNLIAGFETPSQGRVRIGAVDVTELAPHRRPLSMIFQENNLFAHLSVADNVGLGRSPSLRLDAGDRTAIAEALARTGLAGKARRMPADLSGGERQRVAIARVLVRDRPVLLLDEPFAALGPALRLEMLDLIDALRRERGLTVLLVTHHPQDAQHACDHMIFIENGHIRDTGTTELFFSRGGPESFHRYIGAIGTAPDFARKPD